MLVGQMGGILLVIGMNTFGMMLGMYLFVGFSVINIVLAMLMEESKMIQVA